MTNSYTDAGVDLDAAATTVDKMKAAVRATYTPNVLADVGSFGGLFALTDLPHAPVLVASTDGVGTKVKLAAELGRWHSLGHDIVNHCVNDILVQNARPLFFLDYVATSKLKPDDIAAVVGGIASACQAAGCALIGGETAEMPGVYVDGAIDIVGTVVGLVDRSTLLPRKETMAAGDVLLALPSNGPHTNGFSLIRKVIAGRDLNQPLADGLSLADALLAPHRGYVTEINALQAAGVSIKGMAHITGGGLVDNVPRVLPDHLTASMVVADERVPPVFHQLLDWSAMSRAEAFRVFNMGIGMVLIVPADQADNALDTLPDAFLLGKLTQRTKDQLAVEISAS